MLIACLILKSFMHKILIVFFIYLASFYQLDAQIFPRESSRLNYRIIGFSFPSKPTVNKYNIEIAAGAYNSEDSFKKNIIKSFSGDNNKIIGEVPAFGKQYTWRYIYMNPVQIKSSFYHFSTGIIPEADTNVTRLRIMKHAEKHKDAYIFSDAARTLYDMNGMPVWFVPESREMPAGNEAVYGGFKFTNEGTITFGWKSKSRSRRRGKDQHQQVYEINYNGEILWKAPNNGKISGDSIEYYHHEFTKLTNGHYMLFGSEFKLLKVPLGADSKLISGDKIIYDSVSNAVYQEIEFGTIIEYDSNNNIVWSWKSSAYFMGSDVYNHTTSDGIYDIEDAHDNAFYFDEKAKIIYVSCRNISRIIKVQYPSGKILKVYGKLYKADTPGYDNKLFYHQHNCRLTKEGYLSVYNNNDRYPGSLPTLLLMQEPVSEQDTLKKVWEYACTIDDKYKFESVPDFGSRGSLMELPDQSMLACMTSVEYTKIFIVSRDKKILWSAMPERWNADEHRWKSYFEYSTFMIINKKELERLIWSFGGAQDDK